jgi:hypothetical protein
MDIIKKNIKNKNLVIKPITTMLTIFYNNESVVSWVILADNIFFFLKMVVRPKHEAV